MSPTESAPPETALHHCLNIQQAFVQPNALMEGFVVFTPDEAAAIVARLRAIQRELEQDRIVIPAGSLRVGDSIHLRAVGDHVERVYPEAASGADEDYGSPILPPAQQDGAAFRGQPTEDR